MGATGVDETSLARLRRWNLVLVVLHVAQAAAVRVL